MPLRERGGGGGLLKLNPGTFGCLVRAPDPILQGQSFLASPSTTLLKLQKQGQNNLSTQNIMMKSTKKKTIVVYAQTFYRARLLFLLGSRSGQNGLTRMLNELGTWVLCPASHHCAEFIIIYSSIVIGVYFCQYLFNAILISNSVLLHCCF